MADMGDRSRWLLRGLLPGRGDELVLVVPGHVPAPPGARPVPPTVVCAALPRCLARPDGRAVVLQLYRALMAPAAAAPSCSPEGELADQLLAVLRAAFERRRLVAYTSWTFAAPAARSAATDLVQTPPEPAPPAPNGTSKPSGSEQEDPVLSFYELQVVDERDAPIVGLAVELDTPAGRHERVTDAGGRVRVDDVPAGHGWARVQPCAVTEATRGYAARPRRLEPLPTGDNWHVRTVAQLNSPMSLPDAEPQRLMIVTRVDLRFESPTTAWGELGVAEEGSWLLQDEGELFVRIHADGTGRRLVILGEAGEPVGAIEPPCIPPPTGEDKCWEPPDIYVVQAGDWLAAIAERYLGSGARWPEIWTLNKAQYPGRSPDVLYPGDRLIMPEEALPLWLRVQALAPMQPAMAPTVLPRPVWLDVAIDELVAAFVAQDEAQLASLLAGIPLEPPEWEPTVGPPLLEHLLFAYCLERTSRPRD